MENKTLDYYMGLEYTIEVQREESGCFAYVKELPGCFAYVEEHESVGSLLTLVEEAKERWLKQALRKGFADEGFTFHSLRHTFASALCNRREYPKVIQSLRGHSSITQTMDTYSHLMQNIGGDAVGGLDEAFG